MKTLILILTLLFEINNDITGEIETSPVTYGDMPEWFFEGGIIGISDRIVDDSLAYKQAISRALTFYSISNSIDLSYVYEYYYMSINKKGGDLDNYKSHWLAEFETSLDNYSYSVKKVHKTKYNETIVLLDVWNDNDKKNNITTISSFMYHYESIDNKDIYGEKQIMITELSGDINKIRWNSTIDNNTIKKISSINNDSYKIIDYICRYTDYGEINESMVFSSTNYGLWNCYIDTFFQAISAFESKIVSIKNTGRQINNDINGVHDDKIQDIARLIMKAEVSCSLVGLSLRNNSLYANWKIIEQ